MLLLKKRTYLNVASISYRRSNISERQIQMVAPKTVVSEK